VEGDGKMIGAELTGLYTMKAGKSEGTGERPKE